MNKVHYYRQPGNRYQPTTQFVKKSFTPASNIFKDDKGYKLEIAIPGFSKEELDIQLVENKLTIAGKYEAPADDSVKFLHKGFGKQAFSMEFSLSDAIDVNSISANVENGILSINLNYKEEAKKVVKSISIN